MTRDGRKFPRKRHAVTSSSTCTLFEWTLTLKELFPKDVNKEYKGFPHKVTCGILPVNSRALYTEGDAQIDAGPAGVWLATVAAAGISRDGQDLLQSALSF